MTDGVLTIREAAERLDVHRETIRRAIKAGELPAQRTGRDWRIEVAALDRFDERRQNEREITVSLTFTELVWRQIVEAASAEGVEPDHFIRSTVGRAVRAR